MGLGTTVKRISLDVMEVAIRPGEIYLSADYAPGNLFTIVGGPVWIKGLFAHVTVALENSGFTGAITVCGVAMQTGAVVLNSSLNDIIMWPLEATAGSVIIPNVAANPMPTLGAVVNNFIGGQLAGPGNIALTINGNLVSTLVFYVVYYRMDPNSEIVVA